jgi:hypothetical protein
VLACGPEAVLSHQDAATLHDLRPVGGGLIHVSAPSRHVLKGIRCHRVRTLHPDDGVVIEGIPVTSLERTLLDLAETLHPQRLRDGLEQAQRQDKLDFLEIEAMIARNNCRHGIKALRPALAESADERPWTQVGAGGTLPGADPRQWPAAAADEPERRGQVGRRRLVGAHARGRDRRLAVSQDEELARGGPPDGRRAGPGRLARRALHLQPLAP